jgi:hypothetical protein
VTSSSALPFPHHTSSRAAHRATLDCLQARSQTAPGHKVLPYLPTKGAKLPYCRRSLIIILQRIRFPPGSSQGRGHACREPGHFALKD